MRKPHLTLPQILTRIALLAFLVTWWLWIAEWLDKPFTYRLLIAYLALGSFATFWNSYAVYRFNRMFKNVRRDEALGLAEPGSTLFAHNQRFRYAARTVESIMIIIVSILGMIGVADKSLAHSHNYIRTVVTYLIGTVSLTAYLTLRDLRVINVIRKGGDAARLSPIVHPEENK